MPEVDAKERQRRQAVARRLKAARQMRDISQRALGDLLEREGFGKHDVGRLERGQIAMQRKHRRALAEHLGVPEEFFEPDMEGAPQLTPPVDPDDLNVLRIEIGGMIDSLTRLSGALEHLMRRFEELSGKQADGQRAR